jgi:hypothetical protein
MKTHTIQHVQVPALGNPKAKFPVPAITPDFSTSFGLFAVVLPGAQHDLESQHVVPQAEQEKSKNYIGEVVDHLYANMGGGDFEELTNRIEAKRSGREFVYLNFTLGKLVEMHGLPRVLEALATVLKEKA